MGWEDDAAEQDERELREEELNQVHSMVPGVFRVTTYQPTDTAPILSSISEEEEEQATNNLKICRNRGQCLEKAAKSFVKAKAHQDNAPRKQKHPTQRSKRKSGI